MPTETGLIEGFGSGKPSGDETSVIEGHGCLIGFDTTSMGTEGWA